MERCWSNYMMLLISNRPKNPTDESLWQIYQSITNPRTWEHAIYVKSSEIYAIQITSSVACACFLHEWTVFFKDWWTSVVISGNYSAPKTQFLPESFNLFTHWNYSSISRHTQLLHQSPFSLMHSVYVLERISKQASLI